MEEKVDETKAWLEAGGKLVIIGWRKVKKFRGSKQMIWSPRIKEITLADIDVWNLYEENQDDNTST